MEAKIEQGQFQGEMAAAIAEACAKATRGEASQMSVCVAAGEAGLRFATRYLENHPELGDAACKALEMCDGDEDAVADASGTMVTSDDDEARIRAAARSRGVEARSPQRGVRVAQVRVLGRQPLDEAPQPLDVRGGLAAVRGHHQGPPSILMILHRGGFIGPDQTGCLRLEDQEPLMPILILIA